MKPPFIASTNRPNDLSLIDCASRISKWYVDPLDVIHSIEGGFWTLIFSIVSTTFLVEYLRPTQGPVIVRFNSSFFKEMCGHKRHVLSRVPFFIENFVMCRQPEDELCIILLYFFFWKV